MVPFDVTFFLTVVMMILCGLVSLRSLVPVGTPINFGVISWIIFVQGKA